MLDFHFLRPWWLVLVVVAVALLWLWRQQSDASRQWRDVIAPHLLNALMIGKTQSVRVQPVHLVSAALILAGIAAAGPTWEKEPPPFSDDKAPMVVAIDLSSTMDATDIAPTRLERAKQKVRDLARLRSGARTGLVVYAGTAHLVAPPAEDPAVLDIFLPALASDLMPVAGKSAAQALTLAGELLDKEQVPGTILFFTDGFDVEQIAAFDEYRRRAPHQVLVLGVGTSKGGPIRTQDNRVATDASGRPIQARFDGESLKRLSSDADIPVASVTLDDSDVQWVQRRAQRHMQAAEARNVELRWKEFGYWLVIPIALLAALWFRRGWIVRWLPVLALALMICAPSSSYAADARFVDLFLTPDQQGRWHFDRGDYAGAAARFEDPLWKGLAFYRAHDYESALGEFARLDSPDAFFLMGNCYAHLNDYDKAMAAYDNALAARAEFPQAIANRKLVAALAAKKKQDDEQQADPNLAPDDIKFDKQGERGKKGMVNAPKAGQLSAEVWMRNLTTSPADFLREKFRIQADESQRPAKDKR